MQKLQDEVWAVLRRDGVVTRRENPDLKGAIDWLREAGNTGWESKLAVRSGGRRYFLDVAFPGPGVVVEIDGRLHETDPGVLENDRSRQNDLVLDGWIVVRFTWTMLTEHPREADPHARRGRRGRSSRRISGEPAQAPPR